MTTTSQYRWRSMQELPEDGDSIWLAVLEWDGKNTHVDYAVAYREIDGTVLKRYEQNDDEIWPPKDCLAWKPCIMPNFVACCPFCNQPICDPIHNPCCQDVIKLCDEVMKENEQ